jgi:protein-disulfide isomerase
MNNNDLSEENIEDGIANKSETRHISKRGFITGESKSYLACFAVAAVFGGLFLKDSLAQKTQERQKLEDMVVKNVTVSEVLAGRTDFLGKKDAPYTLVEFGDYECPPCRGNQAPLAEMMKRYEGKIKLDFHQMPLTSIHKYAQESALAAESARASGKFWAVHEKLFATDFTQKDAIKKVLADNAVSLTKDNASKQVIADGDLAKKLDIKGTPSFLLVTPKGKIIRLPNLGELPNFL